MAHAGAETIPQGLPGVVLRIANSIFDACATGNAASNRGSQRTARAMKAAGESFPAVAADDSFATVKRVDDLRRVFVGASDQYMLHAQGVVCAPQRQRAGSEPTAAPAVGGRERESVADVLEAAGVDDVTEEQAAEAAAKAREITS